MNTPTSPKNINGRLSSSLDNVLGLLTIRIKRGVNLAVRDFCTSDPYVVVQMGIQTLKTQVIESDVNPEWNEDLTISVSDPSIPVNLTVYDYDTFSKDDKMGEAEFDIRPYLKALKMEFDWLPSGTILARIQPSGSNNLSDESCIVWKEGKIIQDMILRLKNVECGEVEVQLQWASPPGAKGSS